jgi:hypothetical protein
MNNRSVQFSLEHERDQSGQPGADDRLGLACYSRPST